jgi:hypothetical protein
MKNHLRVALAATLAITSAPVLTAAQPGEEAQEIECPEFIRGAQLKLSDSAQGMSFTITTPRTQYVEELRLALTQAASFLEHRTASMAGTDDPMSRIPPVVVAVRPIDSGMQVTVRARKVTDVALLRKQGRMLELMWQHSTCINGDPAGPSSVSA